MNPGITFRNGTAHFVVHSNANRLWLLLFDTPDAQRPAREIPMEGPVNGLWHAKVKGLRPGALYLYKTDAVPEQWLLDPYARAVQAPRRWGDHAGLAPGHPVRKGRHFPKCVWIQNRFNWTGERRPRTPLEKTVIYEAHLRGATRKDGGGTYLDFIGKIPWLKSLGITAVEFLPLFEFNELEYFQEGGPRRNLLNYWGYSTMAFFAPMSRYASSTEPGVAVREFKTLVKALHKAGIEVILDVVFNHTAEGDFNGPVYSFRGLDEAAYYMINADGTYPNWSGCGNTVNANHPVTTQFITDCLCYWAEEMHVDGFRFDLATALCRDSNGALLENPPLIEAIEAAPALRHVKLIAEAWDAHGGYQVGSFPGNRFSEWNGRFRDEVRRFWNNGESIGSLATRLAGSSDLYGHNGLSPLKSINFITAHDGFTLADLVRYERKHNEANQENNRDGENHNDSISFGHEGPSDNPDIQALRLKQQKNLLATLLLSRGVPMLCAGDEFGRTQKGNNNAYCQDNPVSWIDWSLAESGRELADFTRELIALRKKHPALYSGSFFTGKGDVAWFGPDGTEPDWYFGRALGMHIRHKKDPMLLLFNNGTSEAVFRLPRPGSWRLLLTTCAKTPPQSGPSGSLAVPPGSLCVLERQ